ncbi:MAG: hypothetical protein ACREI8_14390 [Myxococcota bacterium]
MERGIVYFAYLQHIYGPSIRDRQRVALVPGVGHSASQMFQSDEGIEALFGSPAPPASPPRPPSRPSPSAPFLF